MLICFLSRLNGDGRVLLNQRVPLESGAQAQVAIPLNDARTASVNVSMEDSTAMRALGPAYSRLLWVYYRPTSVHIPELVFLGPIFRPQWNFGSGSVLLSAHDPLIYAKKSWHRYGDIAVERGYTVDGRGMRDVWSSVIPSEAQIARGVKHPGVYWGYNDTLTLKRPARGKYGKDPENTSYAYSKKAERGQNVFETMQELTTYDEVGIDFDLKPWDIYDKGDIFKPATGYPNYQAARRQERGSRPAPLGSNIWYGQLDTFKASTGKGVVLPAQTTFQYGFGLQNLDDLQVTSDGDQEANYSVVTPPSGEDNKKDTKRRALRHNETAWRDHGIIQHWETSDAEEDKKMLELRAAGRVKSYGWAPLFLSATLKPDTYYSSVHGPRKYAFFDFEHGDIIKVAGKRGYAKFWHKGKLTNEVNARISQIQLTESPEAGGTIQQVDLVPDIDGVEMSLGGGE